MRLQAYDGDDKATSAPTTQGRPQLDAGSAHLTPPMSVMPGRNSTVTAKTS
jgi:hypothetical protein